jgi:hypothetical protein
LVYFLSGVNGNIEDTEHSLSFIIESLEFQLIRWVIICPIYCNRETSRNCYKFLYSSNIWGFPGVWNIRGINSKWNHHNIGIYICNYESSLVMEINCWRICQENILSLLVYWQFMFTCQLSLSYPSCVANTLKIL